MLRERAQSYAGVLSGGEQQMLVLGRALLATPKVLLLDEMTTGLAPKIVGQLRTLVADLAAEGVTVLIAEPSLAALRPIVQRGYVMQRGRDHRHLRRCRRTGHRIQAVDGRRRRREGELT